MSQRVNLSGEVKSDKDGAVAKASLNRAHVTFGYQSLGLDTKPGELPMDRLKRD